LHWPITDAGPAPHAQPAPSPSPLFLRR
jgi:hypothetical protein